MSDGDESASSNAGPNSVEMVSAAPKSACCSHYANGHVRPTALVPLCALTLFLPPSLASKLTQNAMGYRAWCDSRCGITRANAQHDAVRPCGRAHLLDCRSQRLWRHCARPLVRCDRPAQAGSIRALAHGAMLRVVRGKDLIRGGFQLARRSRGRRQLVPSRTLLPHVQIFQQRSTRPSGDMEHALKGRKLNGFIRLYSSAIFIALPVRRASAFVVALAEV